MENGTEKVPINDLPVELLLKIFSYFTPEQLSKFVAPVCRKWWNISKDASLWKDISFVIPPDKNITSYCEVLLRCELVNSIQIKSAIPLDCIIFCFIQLRPNFLKNLDLGFCKGLNAESLAIVVSNCPQIESLNLEGCGLGIDLNCIYHVVSLSQLRSLNLSRCFKIDDMCIRIIAMHCQKLELLNIDNLSSVTDYSVCELAERRQDTLSHLFLDGEELTDESIMSLSNCRNLKTLCISCGSQLTDISLEALSSLPHLTWFKLRECSATAAALETFFTKPNLKSIQVLELETLMIDDRGVENMAKTCCNLRILSLSCCYEVTDKGLQAVVSFCPLLFWLDLTYLFALTDEWLFDIPPRLPSLKYLDLVDCYNIEMSAIQHLSQEMPHLRIKHTCEEVDKLEDCQEEVKMVTLPINESPKVVWSKFPEGFSDSS